MHAVDAVVFPEGFLFVQPCLMVLLPQPLEVSGLFRVTCRHHIPIQHAIRVENLSLEVQSNARIHEIDDHDHDGVYPGRRRCELVEELEAGVVGTRVQIEALDR